MLDLQRPGRALDGSATPYLVHDGAIEAAGALAGWGTATAGASGGGPGWSRRSSRGSTRSALRTPADLAALWRGALPRTAAVRARSSMAGH